VGMSAFAAVVPEPDHEAARLSWADLPVSQRDGVSHSFLVAILEAWRIPDDMTTYELCDQFVKPACRKANSGFLDVLLKTECPGDWFGPMNVFVSHWFVLFVTRWPDRRACFDQNVFDIKKMLALAGGVTRPLIW